MCYQGQIYRNAIVILIRGEVNESALKALLPVFSLMLF